mgnify:CR=1 FL=1
MNTEEQTSNGPKHRGPGSRGGMMVPNKYLDPKDYSRYSFTSEFLSSAEEIIESIECLETYFHSKDQTGIIEMLVKASSNNREHMEIQLVALLLDIGTDMAFGLPMIISRPSLNIPIRQAFIDSAFTLANGSSTLHQYIEARLIKQHLSIEATAIREILSSGLRSYIRDTHFEYDTLETLLKHLQYLYDTVDEDELTEDEMSIYSGNIIERIDKVHPRFNSEFVGMIETTWEFYNIRKHIDLGPYMHGEKLENSDNAHNVIHGYLRLWHKEDTSPKDI